MSNRKNRILTVGFALMTACGGGRGNEVAMQQAARIHNETMARAIVVEQQISKYEADTLLSISHDSLTHWRELLEAWEEDIVEVPGNEAHHTHAQDGHHHDHTLPNVTGQQMLEIQQALARRLNDLSQRIHP